MDMGENITFLVEEGLERFILYIQTLINVAIAIIDLEEVADSLEQPARLYI